MTICDLRGPFVNVNAGVGAGPNVSLDQFYGLSPNGPVVGVGGTVGAGVGAGAALAVTLTRVDVIGRIGKRKCGC